MLHHSLLSRIPVSSDREKLNVVEQKNSKNVQDGHSMTELGLEVKQNISINKNKDLVLPGSHLKVHNNTQAILENQHFRGTGSLALTEDNQYLAVLSNEGVLLFSTHKSDSVTSGSLDLFEIKVQEGYLLSNSLFLFSLRYLKSKIIRKIILSVLIN